jgi:ATP phosphoribosyltransferase
MTLTPTDVLRIALPKGRMNDGIVQLLSDAGIRLQVDARGYRPRLSLDRVEVKLLKPQNIVGMLQVGSRDVGFAGADWVSELDGQVVELLDTGLDPVQLVAAAPLELLVDGELPNLPLRIASEYEQLTRRWVARQGLNATFVKSWGATEVFPPEDADCIVDNTSTGATLRANGLHIVDVVMHSSTRMVASPAALDDPHKRSRIEDLVMVLQSVLEARKRVMVEVNVSAERLQEVLAVLPCMREPTVSKLAGDAGFALKAAVPRDDLPTLVPSLKANGGSDIAISRLSQIVV